jgi:hypothetical protein
MKKNNKVAVCTDIKFKDFMTKSFLAGRVKKNQLVCVHDGDSCQYMVVKVNGSENFFPISVGSEYTDHRYKCTFKELDINYIVDYGIPDIDNAKEIEEWIEAEPEIEDDGEILPQDEELEEISEAFEILQSEAPSLATSIKEAVVSVMNSYPGELVERDREKILSSIRELISTYRRNSDMDALYMAQYLLFYTISLAKKNWICGDS